MKRAVSRNEEHRRGSLIYRIALFLLAVALCMVAAANAPSRLVEPLTVLALLVLLGDAIRVRYTSAEIGFEAAPVLGSVLLLHDVATGLVPVFAGVLVSRLVASTFRRKWSSEVLFAPAQAALSFGFGSLLYVTAVSSEAALHARLAGSLLLFAGYAAMRILLSFLDRALCRRSLAASLSAEAKLLLRSILLLAPFVAIHVLLEPSLHEAAAPGAFVGVLLVAFLMRNEAEAERRSESLTRRNRELTLIRTSQQKLMSAEGDEETFRRLSILLSNLIPVRACAVVIWERGQRPMAVYRFAECQQSDQAILRWVNASGFSSEIASSPTIYKGPGRLFALHDDPELQQVIVAIKTGEMVYGMVVFETADRAIRDPETLNLIGLLVDQTGVSIQDRMLGSDLRQQTVELEQNRDTLSRILKVSQSLIVSTDVNAILHDVVHAVQEALGSEVVYIALRGERESEREIFVPRAHAGLDEAWEEFRRKTMAVEDISRYFVPEFATGHSYFIPSKRVWEEDSLTFLREEAEGFSLRDWNDLDLILVPLKQADELIGYLAVREHADGRPPGENKTAALEIFARQVVAALQSAAQYEEIQRLAQRDALTSAFNHRYFQEQLRRDIQYHQRMGRQFGLVMLDIDNFKRMNDTYGHPAGDEILKGMVREVTHNLRDEVDIVCRYGGEEFAVILRDTDSHHVERVAERIRSCVEGLKFNMNGHGSLNVTISCGVSVFPRDGQSATELIGKADAALFVAKKRGKNQVALAISEPHPEEA